MAMLTRDQILARDDLPRQKIRIAEWGNDCVYVRTLTASEKDSLEGYLKDHPHVNVRAYVAVLTVCDDQGQPIFTKDDVEALGRKSGAALDRIFSAAIKLSMFTPEDVDALEKKSAATPSSAGNTA